MVRVDLDRIGEMILLGKYGYVQKDVGDLLEREHERHAKDPHKVWTARLLIMPSSLPDVGVAASADFFRDLSMHIGWKSGFQLAEPLELLALAASWDSIPGFDGVVALQQDDALRWQGLLVSQDDHERKIFPFNEEVDNIQDNDGVLIAVDRTF